MSLTGWTETCSSKCSNLVWNQAVWRDLLAAMPNSCVIQSCSECLKLVGFIYLNHRFILIHNISWFITGLFPICLPSTHIFNLWRPFPYLHPTPLGAHSMESRRPDFCRKNSQSSMKGFPYRKAQENHTWWLKTHGFSVEFPKNKSSHWSLIRRRPCSFGAWLLPDARCFDLLTASGEKNMEADSLEIARR